MAVSRAAESLQRHNDVALSTRRQGAAWSFARRRQLPRQHSAMIDERTALGIAHHHIRGMSRRLEGIRNPEIPQAAPFGLGEGPVPAVLQRVARIWRLENPRLCSRTGDIGRLAH